MSAAALIIYEYFNKIRAMMWPLYDDMTNIVFSFIDSDLLSRLAPRLFAHVQNMPIYVPCASFNIYHWSEVYIDVRTEICFEGRWIENNITFYLNLNEYIKSIIDSRLNMVLQLNTNLSKMRKIIDRNLWHEPCKIIASEITNAFITSAKKTIARL